MAGRIRTIKPEFLDDEKLCSMNVVTRLLFAATWLLADDYGNLRSSESWIHGQVFHSDPEVVVEQIHEALARLTREGMLQAYSVRGQGYYHVANWHRHQRIDRPGKPKVPGPKEADSSELDSDSTIVSEPVPRSIHEPIATEQGTGNREQGSGTGNREGESGGGRSASPRAQRSPASVLDDDWKPSERQVNALATKHGVKPARILAEVPEFIWYWTEGKGSGKRRSSRGWAQAFGNRVDQQAQREVLFAEPRNRASRGSSKAAIEAQIASEREWRRKHHQRPANALPVGDDPWGLKSGGGPQREAEPAQRRDVAAMLPGIAKPVEPTPTHTGRKLTAEEIDAELLATEPKEP